MSPLAAVALILVFAIVMIGGAVYVIWAFRKNATNTQALQERGVTTMATVVKHTSTLRENKRNSNRRAYWLVLEYTVDGTSYQQTLWVYKNVYDSFPDGSDLEILYLPENPKAIMRKEPA